MFRAPMPSCLRYILCIGLFFLCLSGLEAQSANQIFRAARSAFSDELWPTAARHFLHFIKSWPDDIRADSAAYMAAISFYNTADYRNSIKLLAFFSRDYPDSVWNQRTNYWLGLAYFESEDWESAALAFRQQARLEDEKTYRERTLFYLGATYERLGHWSEAAQAYSDLIVMGRSFKLVSDSLLRLGKMQMAMGKYEEALDSFRNLAYNYSESPISTEANYWIGQTLVMMRHREEALQSYQDFLETVYNSPNRSHALLEAARLSLYLDKHSEALAYLDMRDREAVSDNSSPPQDASVKLAMLKIRASSWLNLGKIIEARRAYMAILKEQLPPRERQRTEFNLAQTWVGTDKMALAVPYLEKASSGPDALIRADALYLAASIEFHQKSDRAESHWKRFVDEFPGENRREEVLRFLVAYWRSRADRQKAIQFLGLLLGDYPDSRNRPDYLFLRGEEYLAAGDSTSALRDYGGVLEDFPDSIQNAADSASRIGFVYAGRGEHVRAASYYVQAADLLGGVSGGKEGRQALYSAAVAFSNGGETEQALKYFSLIIDDNPSAVWGVESAYYRAEMFLDLGMLEEARQSYQIAIQYGDKEWQFDATYGMGWTWYREKEQDRAAQYFNKAMQLASNPQKASLAAYRMALSLAAAGELEESLVILDKVLEMDVAERREKTLYQKSWVLLNLGRDDDFDVALTALRREFPESDLPADIYYRMGNRLLDEGDYLESIRWFDLCGRYFENSDLAIQAELRAARAAALSGNLPDSSRRYRNWVQRHPGHSGLMSVVRSWSGVLRHMDAEAPIQAALNLLTGLPLVNNEAVTAPVKLVWLARNGVEKISAGILEDMVNNPSLSSIDRDEALLLRTGLYLEDGQYERARQVYETLVRKDDGRIGALAQEGLARSFLGLGQMDKAADAYLALMYLYSDQEDVVRRAKVEAVRLLKLTGREDEVRKLTEDFGSTGN